MDAQKASYSIALMAKVLGVTRAGYDAWKTERPTGVSARWCGGVWMWVAGGRGIDAPPAPHRPEHAPAPGQARRTGSSGPEDHCARQWNQGATDRVRITYFTYRRLHRKRS